MFTKLKCINIIFFVLFILHSNLGQGSLNFNNVLKNDIVVDELLQLTIIAETHFQNNNFDSAIYFATHAINKELHIETPSVTRSRNLLTTARAYEKKGQRGSSLKFYLRSIKEIEGLDDDSLLADVFVEVSNLYSAWDASAKALEYLLIADSKKMALNDNTSRITILKKINDIYEKEGNYEKLIENCTHLVAIYAATGAKKEQLSVLKRKTEAYRKLAFYEKALNNHLKILNISKENEEVIETAEALNVIGYIYKELGSYKESLGYFLQFLILCKELRMDNYQFKKYSEALLTIGGIYQQLGDAGEKVNYNHALNSYDKKLQVSIKANDYEGIARTYNQMSLIYRKLKEYNSSIKYGDYALEIAVKLDNKQVLRESYYNLYLSYKAKKKEKQTLQYYTSYTEINESILEDQLLKQKELLEREAAENRKQFIINKTEQMIVGEELDTLHVKRLQLEGEKREKDLELLIIDKELKETELKNAQLKREKALQELILMQNQFEDERKAKEITLLKKDREIQAYALKQKELEEKDRQKAISMLEKDRALKELEISKQETINKYSIAGITLITIILCLILFNYLQTRKVNKQLGIQKHHIQKQAETLEKAYKNLELLSKIGQDITASLSIQRITEIAYNNVNKLMDASVFGIGIVNSETTHLEFPVIIENKKTLNGIYFNSNEQCLANFCVQRRKEISIGNLDIEYNHYFPGSLPIPKAGEINASSVIYIPLIIKEKCVGVLTVQSFEVHAYTNYHINILRNMAIYIQIAFENANAYRQIADKSKTLRIANENVKHQKDLIELKNTELLKLDNEKNHLIGILAHDLRNPLAIAISLTDFLKLNHTNLTSEQVEGLNITNRSLIRMNEMITRILDIKAVEAKKVNLNLETLDIEELLHQVIENFNENLKKKRLELKLEVYTSSSFVNLDYTYSIQVFENLISNAIKFSPKGKKITIKLLEVEDRLKIVFTDEGPGIKPIDFPKLFGKYQRLSAKPTDGEMSTGLGLSIVKKYVEVMNGKVWCESEFGNGANFIVEFKKEAVLAV